MARDSSQVSWVVRAVFSGLTLPGSRSELSFMRVRPDGLKVKGKPKKIKFFSSGRAESRMGARWIQSES